MTRIHFQELPAHPATIEVKGAELHYLSRVRRHTTGDSVEVFDSLGRRFTARIEQITRHSALLRVEQELPRAPDAWPVSLVVAVPKGRLFDEVIRRLSEIGIATLMPVIAARTNSRPGMNRLDRWRRIAAESARLCWRREPLRVSEVQCLSDALTHCAGASRKLILDPGQPAPGAFGESFARARAGSIALAVGPEGGFTPEELAIARQLKFETATLGPHIMRIETAAVVGAALAVALIGGFN